MQPQPRESVPVDHTLRRYVLPTETVVLATRRHWASVLEPAATCAGALLLVATIVLATPPDGHSVVRWLWLGWLATFLRFAFRWLEWRHEWFVSTDKRLLLLYGLVIHKVAMMPLMKVTDMGYTRTPLGQLLGYGRFVMESAGQDQALRQVDYVPHPDATYRTLCAEIFRPRPGPPHAMPFGEAGPRPVVIPGRSAVDEGRPTTQPIPIQGRASTGEARGPMPTSRPPRLDAIRAGSPHHGDPLSGDPLSGDPLSGVARGHAPYDGAPRDGAPRDGAPRDGAGRMPQDGASGTDGTSAPTPSWDTPTDWTLPKPYDPNPR